MRHRVQSRPHTVPSPRGCFGSAVTCPSDASYRRGHRRGWEKQDGAGADHHVEAVEDRPRRGGTKDRHSLRPNPTSPRIRPRPLARGFGNPHRPRVSAGRSAWQCCVRAAVGRSGGGRRQGARRRCRHQPPQLFGSQPTSWAGDQRGAGCRLNAQDQRPDRPRQRRHCSPGTSPRRQAVRRKRRGGATRCW